MIRKSISILILSTLCLWESYAQSLTQIEEARKLVGSYAINGANSVNNVDNTTVISPLPRGGYSERPSPGVVVNLDSMSIFGHELFGPGFQNYYPSINIPTPQSYILSQGDELIIELSGDVVKRYVVVVSPDGTIYIPDIGSLYLSGRTIASAQQFLIEALSPIYSALVGENPTISLKLSLGSVGSVTVNVVGDVAAPGSYTIPALSTTLSALYMAGGVTNRGSVREVSLYRDGKLLDSFDLYDYIFNIASVKNHRLHDNDLIVVSSYANLVQISGGVKRPMRYELVDGETIADLLSYAGGFTGNGVEKSLYVVRSSAPLQHSYVVKEGDFDSFVLRDGDIVSVKFNSDLSQNRVYVGEGVLLPGNYAIDENISTLSDLITEAGGITENAYKERAYIYRSSEDYSPIAVSVDLRAVLEGRSDVALVRNDSIILFSTEELYDGATISVSGAVNSSGEFEFREGMTLADAILLANGYSNGATKGRIEVARRNITGNSLYPSDTVATVMVVNLVASPMADTMLLAPYDMVMVRFAPDYRRQQSVLVTGEVLFPGLHVVETDEVRLSDVIDKAGGFLPGAYVRGARLTRHLNSDEVERLRLASEIANEKLKSAGDTLRIDPAKLGDSYDIAIDLVMAVNNPHSEYDVVLRGGDEIKVPKYNNTVKVSGGVMVPHTVTYNPDYSWKDYVGTSGGFVKRAIKSKAYFVYMNGSISTRSFGVFKAEPGCELVIPEKSINRSRFSLAEGLSLSTSITSLAAILVTLFRN
ncbi:MAG: SLBB domain-containing protein [Marinifilaceae bacterium]|nr:SLBB domain-containing protein [Marinifilaceae bacterium]